MLPPQLPSPGTFSYLLLLLTAISGEYPVSQVSRLPGGSFYKANMVTQLKRDRLLRTYYRDGLRALRLTATAKSLLLATYPDVFRLYLTGNAETNVLKSEVPRRIRLHRMAEVLTTMFNSGISVFSWDKADLFTPSSTNGADDVPLPSYYSSREVKELGPLATKIRGSRSTGVLLADGGIFVAYNTGASLMKWEYRAEMRLKALLQMEICHRRLSEQFRNTPIQGIVFGSDMEAMASLMGNTPQLHRNYFILDDNFDSFHFLTCDHRGEVILQLLCHPEQRSVLDGILSENLDHRHPGWTIEHDAIGATNTPVLFAYTCDMPRIRRFDTALELQGRVGTLICFDFQESVLRRICGSKVTIQSIDFDKYEGSVFHIEKDMA